ncbi:hypothetical protein AN958_12214 [Leucoagaricus sp. SymC.cos]|nr:hypothetical protein AN958_12214 [Leucoagaricus sp. SymC.cos]
MPRSNSTIPSPIPSARPPIADIELAALVSLQNVRTSSLPNSQLSRPKAARKPVPSVVANPVTFPADDTSHPDSSTTFTSQRRQTTSGPSATSTYKRTMSSPSPSPPPPRLVPRSPLVSAGQPAAGPGLTSAFANLSSSLSRNSSVPASLSHNTPLSNHPARASSVSQTRPSLSSPSPPTPIVPSIPLRHATQHSPSHSLHTTPILSVPLTPKTPSSAPTTLPRGSLDRSTPTKKPLPEHSPILTSFATASDPNLASRPTSFTPVMPFEQQQQQSPQTQSYYMLPWKQLLAKPANPSAFHVGSGSGGEGNQIEGGPHLNFAHASHRRSASTIDSVVQFATPRLNSDISIIELAATHTLHSRSPVAAKPGVGERYHYKRTTDCQSKEAKSEVKAKIQAGDGGGWWPDWKQEEDRVPKPLKDKSKDKASEQSRPRNVLKRRPSNSTRPSATDTRASSPSTGFRLSRSLSTSSLLKRAGLFTTLNPNIRSISPLPPSKSPIPKSSSDASGAASPVMFNSKLSTKADADDRGKCQSSHFLTLVSYRCFRNSIFGRL